ncbi:MAG TPA: outer membrane beta-barrel protein [Stellaceae bacterium]|nr:outer membrane beta-barrel protein [Stellaceae bacterium]
MKRVFATLPVAALMGLAALSPAMADDKTPPPPPSWSDTIKFSGFLEAGIQGNPDSPQSGLNWGRLFDDRANTPVLNQANVTLTRPTDPNATGYDVGFILNGLFGTDARYTHFLGEFDRATGAQYQYTPIEADLLVHLPWFTSGGVDAKLGQFPTLLTAEQTPATANPLYSHSYIFNFGAPISHTGLWTITHLNPMIDIYLGVDTGNETTLGSGDNNSAIAGLTGINLTLLDGNITILWLNHMGPENPSDAGLAFNANGAYRFEDTITTVVKYNDETTFTTDLNYIRDNGFKAEAYGVAQYVAYALNDQFTLQLRGELWRDEQGFFVTAFRGPLDPVNALRGIPSAGIITTGHPTTYGEITLGVNYKPPLPSSVPAAFSGILLRPEIRYDTAFGNARPFDVNNAGIGTKSNQLTIGGDIILPF